MATTERKEETKPEAAAVVALETSNIQVRSFAASLPPSITHSVEEDGGSRPAPKVDVIGMFGDNCIVGTVMTMKKTAKIWVGWGKVDASIGGVATTADAQEQTSRVGSGAPAMGNLVVAMPRSNFRGAFSTSSANDLPSSSLIGTDSSEDHILASQMASRLAKRSGRAVFVSCNLMTGGDGLADAGSSDAWMMGLSQDLVAQRAAAIAEKEIWTILSQG